MSEEVKEEAKELNLFEVIDKTLSDALLRVCTNHDMLDDEILNSLLDASIKFHQLTASIQRSNMEAADSRKRHDEIKALIEKVQEVKA